MAKLTKLVGLSPSTAESLRNVGVRTTGALIKKGGTPEGRQEIFELTTIRTEDLLRWVAHIDFFRISGVGAEYAALLELSEIQDVPALAQQDTEYLYRKLAKVNREKELVKKLPTRYQINDWINQARRLKALISY